MNSERHSKEIYYLRILLLLILASTLPAKTYPAVNPNGESTLSPNLNSLTARGVKTDLTFHAIYELQPISKVLYDLSTYFDFNSLILDLEERIISHEFRHCNFHQCLKELHNTGRVRMQYGTNFAVFSRSESSIPNLGNKLIKIQQQLRSKEKTSIEISIHSGSLFLALEKIIKEGNFPLKLSNQVSGRISLHIESAIPFETLFYVMQYYKLRIWEKNHIRTIVPQSID